MYGLWHDPYTIIHSVQRQNNINPSDLPINVISYYLLFLIFYTWCVCTFIYLSLVIECGTCF